VIGQPARLHQNPVNPHPILVAAYPGVAHEPMLAAPADGSSRSTPTPPPRRDVTPSGGVCRLLSLLADKTRLKILRLLADGERPVVSLTGALRLPQPTVSHHLAWLRMMDLVSPRRQGKHVFYALGPAARWGDGGVLTLTADDATVTITPLKAD
jgi:DNA-binding transcriptional ArsR family regulator